MHTRHSLPHTQIIVIRPLIFPSLPSSLGMTSNRATLTSQGSCSSHTGFNINWFFFSPAASLIRILRRISELSPGSNVSLSQSGRLYNYTGQQRAIQFFTWFSSAEVIPPSFSPPSLPVLSVSFLLHAVRLEAFPQIKTPASSPPPSSCSCDWFLSWSRGYYHHMTFWKDPTIKTYTRDIFLSRSPDLKWLSISFMFFPPLHPTYFC